MRLPLVLLLTCLIGDTAVAGMSQIDSASSKSEEKGFIEQAFAPQYSSAGSLNTFDFHSNNGDLFNRYSGESKFLDIRADNIKVNSFYLGLAPYLTTTEVDSTSRLTNSAYAQAHSTINNAGIGGHIMRIFKNIFFVDVFGGYSNSTFDVDSTVVKSAFPTGYGSAHFHGNNGVLGARTFLAYPFGKFTLQGDASFWAGRFHQPGYNIGYNTGPLFVNALTTYVYTLNENARLFYKCTESFRPFISGGLVQVPRFSYSRAVVTFNPVAPLPVLTLDQSGYSVGGGLLYQSNLVRVMPSYTHTRRGSVFTSDTFNLKVDLLMQA